MPKHKNLLQRLSCGIEVQVASGNTAGFPTSRVARLSTNNGAYLKAMWAVWFHTFVRPRESRGHGTIGKHPNVHLPPPVRRFLHPLDSHCRGTLAPPPNGHSAPQQRMSARPWDSRGKKHGSRGKCPSFAASMHVASSEGHPFL